MHSLCLVTAALLSGAVDPPAGGCNCGTAQPQAGVVYYQPAPMTLRDRLHNLFGSHQGSPYHAQTVQYVAAPAAAPAAPAAVQTAPPPEAITVVAKRPDLPIAKKYEDKVGHEEDYSWVTGHLFYVRADGGRWVVRYGLLDQEDKFGGSVVLAPTVEMHNFREGDLVCVHGEVIDQRASPSLGGALYRVNSISMVERADP
jgi:hypothetical protein